MRVILTLIGQEVLKNSALCGNNITHDDTDMITLRHLCSNTVMVHKVTLTCQHVTSVVIRTHVRTRTFANSVTDMAACNFVFTNSDTTKAACDICVYTHWRVCCHILLHLTIKPNRCNFMHLQKLGLFNLKLVKVILKMKQCLVDAILLYHWSDWCGLEHWEIWFILAISTLVPYILKLLCTEN